MIKGLTKGKTATLEFTVNENVSNWKIRAEIFDNCGHCLKLATSNTGGADNQILVTDVNNGIFELFIPSGATECFRDKSMIEIEADTGNTVGGKPEILPLYEDDILFKRSEIDWTTP